MVMLYRHRPMFYNHTIKEEAFSPLADLKMPNSAIQSSSLKKNKRGTGS
jgi:hypothetical protein